jgi:hypothetical protein
MEKKIRKSKMNEIQTDSLEKTEKYLKRLKIQNSIIKKILEPIKAADSQDEKIRNN